MANKSLFQSIRGRFVPKANAVNKAGGKAYKLSSEQALAQLALTGTFNQTFYANGADQLEDVLRLTDDVDAEFLAKLAVYARVQGHMKDMPALLMAVLASRYGNEFDQVFPKVIDNAKMVRNFVQMMRSGVTGRKSMGSRPKRHVVDWLKNQNARSLLFASVGNQPSLADVIKMVHPKPETAAQAAMFAYLIRKPYSVADLPKEILAFENFKRDQSLAVPNVPFQLLSSLTLSKEQWVEVAKNTGWQMLRMNLNTFARNDVYSVPGFSEYLASRLGDPAEVRRSRVMPYQLMVAYYNTMGSVPQVVNDALQTAMDTALANVPKLAGNVVVCPDVSGSMHSPVTGHRQGATSAVRCVDVAGLVAAAFMNVNPQTRVLPFKENVVNVRLNPRDSVMTNATKLASLGYGGTNCSAPLLKLAKEKAKVDLVVFVSDNESWMDKTYYSATGKMAAWAKVKANNPNAKLVCLDIQPSTTTPAKSGADVLNVGGFSDQVFNVIADFANLPTMGIGNLGPDHWVETINQVEL